MQASVGLDDLKASWWAIEEIICSIVTVTLFLFQLYWGFCQHMWHMLWATIITYAFSGTLLLFIIQSIMRWIWPGSIPRQRRWTFLEGGQLALWSAFDKKIRNLEHYYIYENFEKEGDLVILFLFLFFLWNFFLIHCQDNWISWKTNKIHWI